MDEECKRKCFFYKWRIENFNFCWHKTGEHLESPLFYTESPPEASWKLLLYPRGEEDGEYISCYLFRAVGGPDVVDVDFELSISVGERLVKPPVSFEKIYSFKNFQKEGDKSFVLRREVSFQKLFWEETLSLTIGCRILIRNGARFEVKERFGRTTIFIESISGIEVLEDVKDLNPENSKDIEVKTLLTDDPLISINLSYFDENITIKILPKSCEKIKYAICKITIVKNWQNRSPIEHVRFWVGEIKTDIWRYEVILPQTESASQDISKNILFVHYYFAYSTGIECTNNELNDYAPDLWIQNISSLESKCEYVEPEKSAGYPTAMNALKLFHASKLFADIIIKTKSSSFNAHKAVLRSRSSELVNMLKDNPESIELGDYRNDIIGRFLLFLYTDSVENMQWEIALDLYSIADKYKVELLKKKCHRFLEINCNPENVTQLVKFSINSKDKTFNSHLMKYIITHDEEVFSTEEWRKFAEEFWTLAEPYMVMKYAKHFSV